MSILSRTTKYDEYIWWFILLITGIIILVCPTYLRGSDQYWYTADAASIAHGFHLGTNNLFPNSFTGNWYAPQRPFIHNRPIIYLVGIVDMLVRHTVYAWKLVNTILLLITVVLVRDGVQMLLKKSVEKEKASRLGMVAGILYLLLPFNFWLVFQPLSTITDAFFTALIFLYIFPRWISASGRKQAGWWLLILGVSILAVFNRKDYLLLLSLGVIAWLWSMKRLWSRYLLYIPALVIGVWLCTPLFPGHLIVRFPVYRLILESRPGVGNMVSFLNPHIGEYSFSALIAILIPKAFHDLWIQIMPGLKLIPFYYVFNMIVLIVAAGVIWGRKKFDDRIKSYGWLTIGMLASFFILIMVYQNHYRYMVSVLPVALAVGFSMSFYWSRSSIKHLKRSRKLIIMIICIFFITDVVLVIGGLHADRHEEREAVLLGKELNTYMKPKELLVSEWNSHAQVIGYMHQSAPCLYIDKRFVIEHSKVFSDPKVKWVVTAGNSEVRKVLGSRIVKSYPLTEGFVLNRLGKGK